MTLWVDGQGDKEVKSRQSLLASSRHGSHGIGSKSGKRGNIAF